MDLLTYFIFFATLPLAVLPYVAHAPFPPEVPDPTSSPDDVPGDTYYRHYYPSSFPDCDADDDLFLRFFEDLYHNQSERSSIERSRMTYALDDTSKRVDNVAQLIDNLLKSPITLTEYKESKAAIHDASIAYRSMHREMSQTLSALQNVLPSTCDILRCSNSTWDDIIPSHKSLVFISKLLGAAPNSSLNDVFREMDKEGSFNAFYTRATTYHEEKIIPRNFFGRAPGWLWRNDLILLSWFLLAFCVVILVLILPSIAIYRKCRRSCSSPPSTTHSAHEIHGIPLAPIHTRKLLSHIYITLLSFTQKSHHP